MFDGASATAFGLLLLFIKKNELKSKVWNEK